MKGTKRKYNQDKSTKILEQLIQQVSLLDENSHKLKELCRELDSSLRGSESN